MKDFSGRIAVVTGAGSGIGRAIACQLAAEGCSLAICDTREDDMIETARRVEAVATQGAKITYFVADVADAERMLAFRDETGRVHKTDQVHLLFNNAGIGGGGSFVNTPVDQWERTFRVCWNGVYNGTRAFLPFLLKADQAHLINVSSVNGFWASLGPDVPHTAYSAAKFAVKGFTEALINDFRLNAPHVKVSLVMPGHIGTNISLHSIQEFSSTPTLSPEMQRAGEAFRDHGMPPEQAAQIILDGVREERWRILVGSDAVALDRAVRADPEAAYGFSFSDLVSSGRDGGPIQ